MVAVPKDILEALSSGFKAWIDDATDGVIISDEDETMGFCITFDSIRTGRYKAVLADSLRILKDRVEMSHARIH